MDFGIKGRTALVFGAGSGLGRAIAQSLSAEGCNVVAAGRTEQKLTETVAGLGGNAVAQVWDLTDIQAIPARLADAVRHFGSVDILVNNTGGPPPGEVQGHSGELWQTWFTSMILPAILIADAVLPNMKEHGWGRIITSTSSGVIAPIPNLGLSNALRTTLLGWSKTLSSEVAPFGITSNIILPGRIATDRIAFLDEKKAERESREVEDICRESLRAIPMGRYGDPQEYGDVAAFLASNQASYITGSLLRVDGGYISSI